MTHKIVFILLQHRAALGELGAFQAFLRALWQQDWVVCAKPPFGSAKQVVAYLGRYTQRIAISKHRLVAFHDGQVSFQWRDYRHGNVIKVMTLAADEFIRRFGDSGAFATMGCSAIAVARSSCQCVVSFWNRQPPSAATRIHGDLDAPSHGDRYRTCCPHCRRGRLEAIMIIYPLWEIDLLPYETQPP